MSEKKNAYFTLGVIAGILLIFSVVDFCHKLELWSGKTEAESFPQARDAILSGELFEAYETFTEEHFYNRDRWEKMVRDVRILLGKREYEGIYLGKDDSFFEIHLKEDYPEECQEQGAAFLERLTQKYGAKVMLIPTADEIRQEDLPAYADHFDQKAFLDRVQNRIGTEYYLDVYEILKAHEDEKIYYETDPHWTSLGAYYGYTVFWKGFDKTAPYVYNLKQCVEVTKHFRGEYFRRTEMDMEEESMQVFPETLRKTVSMTLDGREIRKSFFRPEFTGSDHPYDYFMGNDFATAEIETGRERSSSLLLIGDSYASSMLPLLAPHYEKIYFVNTENYSKDLSGLLTRYGKQEHRDILVLQSVTNFLDGMKTEQEE